MSSDLALGAVRTRAAASSDAARTRWIAATGSAGRDLDGWPERFAAAGRVTLNFHPDRLTRSGRSVAAGLLAGGRYRSQWVTGISNGSRSAVFGGDRHGFERELFDGAYEVADPALIELPVYGSLDLLRDPHGGSPRFGSSYLVLHPHVLDRTTMCVGDSHAHPRDVGAADEPWSLLAGLAEQAAAGSLLEREMGVGDLLDVLRGDAAPRSPARSLDGYVEAQVHGGVDLATDVNAVVLDPSFAGTGVERDLRRAAERWAFELAWHGGSELAARDVPADFRGPEMPDVARGAARDDGIVDACSIGRLANRFLPGPTAIEGDAPDSGQQRVKYLWHTLLAFGHDAAR